MATTELATFGGGCFWCTEAVFQQLRGVRSVVSGYCGGTTPSPTYKDVCSGATGHAEVIQVEYDPAEISYRDLLEVFFATHDPTTLNRQGADVGTQYRSIILTHNDEQREIAQQSLAETDASGLYRDAIVTQIVPLTEFYPAEAYHQDYYRNNPSQGYCRIVIDPKVRKMRKEFSHMLKEGA
jgi:peptide-methionine (S)-S-oxide reductase